jgi:hypothetical protein
MIRTGYDNIGEPALAGAEVGNTMSSTGLKVATSLGDNVSPSSLGNGDGANDGMSVGKAVVVGKDVLGAIETVGDPETVGAPVSYRTHSVCVGATQRGVKASNCCTVWKIAENSQRLPLLLVTKILADRSPLPKTTTSDEPTALFSKQVFVIVTCPNDSTRKLCVSG